MKKFNYFLLTAITLFFTTIELNAFTTTTNNINFVQEIDYLPSVLTDITESLTSTVGASFEFNELQVSTSNSTELIKNNLTLLYSICVALVLFNLIAQVKIIYQMIHLFSQFQKKDEFAGYTFQ